MSDRSNQTQEPHPARHKWPAYDVFLSYTKRRDLARARSLNHYLVKAGYRLWFDENVLSRKTSWVPTAKSAIVDVLSSGIAQSRCTVLFAITVALVRERIDLDVAKAISCNQCMRDDNGQLISWNWQLFELGLSTQWGAIYGEESWEAIGNELRSRGIQPSARQLSSPIIRRFMRCFGRRRRVARLFSHGMGNANEVFCRMTAEASLRIMVKCAGRSKYDPNIIVVVGLEAAAGRLCFELHYLTRRRTARLERCSSGYRNSTTCLYGVIACCHCRNGRSS